MPTPFQQALDRLLYVEGGYSDHPADSGGRTRWGVTEALARRYGYRGSMRTYPREAAEEVYYEHFWRPMHLDEVAQIAGEELAYELFEAAVNLGRSRPARWLQRLLNVLNLRGTLYPDLREDGLVGPNTLGALQAFVRRRGPEGVTVLQKGLDALQGTFYIELAERRQKDEAFIYGWLRTRI